MELRKRKEGKRFYFLRFAYTNVPSALMANTAANMTTATEEYSGIVGTVTVLLVGTKNACIATSLAGIVKLSVLEV